MKVKVEVPLDDLIDLWVSFNCDDIAPSCNTYCHDGFQDVIEIEFSDEDEE